jgi:transposase
LEQQGVCPGCGVGCRIYDHREERFWRHLDTMQFQTIVHCRIPRVNCPEHGIKYGGGVGREALTVYSAV